MIRRREVLATAALLAVMGGAYAQSALPPLIVWLRTASGEQPPGGTMREALASHGLMDGRDYRLVLKNTGGDNARFKTLAQESVTEGASLIIAFGPAAARAAAATTRTIPIVASGAIVEHGLAMSRGRPGGNVTGVDISAPELDLKKIELLKELIPNSGRITFIHDPTIVAGDRDAPLRTAARLGVTLDISPVGNTNDIRAAVMRAVDTGGIVNFGNSPLISQNRQFITDLVRQHRIAAICEWREMAAAGCLASYGFELDALIGLVADQVQRILRGASSADLPIVTPTRFRFVVNLRVARDLGIEIPIALLARADEVIE